MAPPTTGDEAEEEEEYAKVLSAEAADAAAVVGAFEGVLPHSLDEPPPPGLAKPKATAKKPAVPGAKREPKKRICKFPGCTKTVKAQGHCQKHGARTKRCKVPNCESQAQGGHEGLCKKHWREIAAPPEERRKPTKKEAEVIERKCEPVGASVYDAIIPSSFMWRADGGGPVGPWSMRKKAEAKSPGLADVSTPRKLEGQGGELIPILHHLAANEQKAPGWHRAEERLSRGIRPPKTQSVQLESWERQLALLEMALCAGTDTGSYSAHKVSRLLAHAWGREKGFQQMTVNKHCARRGDLDRKSRVDKGVPMTAEKRADFKTKLSATKRKKKRKAEELTEALGEVEVPMDGAGATADPMLAAVPLAEEGGVQALADADAEAAGYAEVPPEPPLEEPSIEEMVTHEI